MSVHKQQKIRKGDKSMQLNNQVKIFPIDQPKNQTINNIDINKGNQNKQEKGFFDFIFDFFRGKQKQEIKVQKQNQVSKEEDQKIVKSKKQIKFSKKFIKNKSSLQEVRTNPQKLDALDNQSTQIQQKNRYKSINNSRVLSKDKLKPADQPYNLNVQKFQKISNHKQQVFKSRPKVNITPRKNNSQYEYQNIEEQKQTKLKNKIKNQEREHKIKNLKRKQVKFLKKELVLPTIGPKPTIQYSDVKQIDLIENIRQNIKKYEQNRQNIQSQCEYQSILLRQNKRYDTEPHSNEPFIKNNRQNINYTQNLRKNHESFVRRSKVYGLN